MRLGHATPRPAHAVVRPGRGAQHRAPSAVRGRTRPEHAPAVDDRGDAPRRRAPRMTDVEAHRRWARGPGKLHGAPRRPRDRQDPGWLPRAGARRRCPPTRPSGAQVALRTRVALGGAVAVVLPAGRPTTTRSARRRPDARSHRPRISRRSSAMPPSRLSICPPTASRIALPRLVGAGLPDLLLGADALERLPRALPAALDERLERGATEDAATLVPGYVALPRGIASAPGRAGQHHHGHRAPG